jgi:hypothetical protein
MKACAIFDEASRTFRVASPPPLKIAQRFNAGFRLGEFRKSLQGRQTHAWLVALLSSLTGLQHFHHLIFPALKRWAIFAKQVANWYQSAAQRDSLRLAS